MSDTLMEIGPIQLHAFGGMAALGLLLGTAVAAGEARRRGISPRNMAACVIYLLVAGIIGARLIYVLLNLSHYSRDSAAIWRLPDGGLTFYGGLVAGLIVGVAFARRCRIAPGSLLDAAAPGLALGMAVGWVGSDIPGSETTVAWAVEAAGRDVHPHPVYAALLCYAIFMVLWRRRRRVRLLGDQVLLFLILYGAGSFLLEGFRAGSTWMLLTPGQWAGLGVLSLAGWLWRSRIPARVAAGIAEDDTQPLLRVPSRPSPAASMLSAMVWSSGAFVLILLFLQRVA